MLHMSKQRRGSHGIEPIEHCWCNFLNWLLLCICMCGVVRCSAQWPHSVFVFVFILYSRTRDSSCIMNKA